VIWCVVLGVVMVCEVNAVMVVGVCGSGGVLIAVMVCMDSVVVIVRRNCSGAGGAVTSHIVVLRSGGGLLLCDGSVS